MFQKAEAFGNVNISESRTIEVGPDDDEPEDAYRLMASGSGADAFVSKRRVITTGLLPAIGARANAAVVLPLSYFFSSFGGRDLRFRRLASRRAASRASRTSFSQAPPGGMMMTNLLIGSSFGRPGRIVAGRLDVLRIAEHGSASLVTAVQHEHSLIAGLHAPSLPQRTPRAPDT
jgi:hypothetical protein